MTHAPRIVVLAAGRGSRMQPLGLDVPKSLLPVCGEPFACRLIRQAQARGVTDISVVVGFARNVVRAAIEHHCGTDIEFIVNTQFADDVNIHSLALALAADARPCHVVEADIYLADDAWDVLLDPADAMRSVWYARGAFAPHQFGGILATADDSRDGAAMTDLRYVACYSERYAHYRKLVGIAKLGPRELPRFAALLMESRDRDMRQYYMQPWIEHLDALPAIARDVGADAADSVNTPAEYRALVRALATTESPHDRPRRGRPDPAEPRTGLQPPPRDSSRPRT